MTLPAVLAGVPLVAVGTREAKPCETRGAVGLILPREVCPVAAVDVPPVGVCWSPAHISTSVISIRSNRRVHTRFLGPTMAFLELQALSRLNLQL